MFIRILNSEMELATGCTEPGAVALTAAEAGQALRKAGVDKAEEITVNASININMRPILFLFISVISSVISDFSVASASHTSRLQAPRTV